MRNPENSCEIWECSKQKLTNMFFCWNLISPYYQNIFLKFVLHPETYTVSHTKDNIKPNNKTNTTSICCWHTGITALL